MDIGHRSASFWSSTMRLAFGVFVAESAAVCVYVLRTPDGDNRLTLAVLAFASACVGSLCGLLVPWIARKPWCERFSLAWTLVAGGALTYAASLDGGLSSPLLLLILLPVTYAGLVFAPSAVGLCASMSVIEVVALRFGNGQPSSDQDRFVVVAAVAAGLGALTWLSSVNRQRLDRRDAALTHELKVLASTDHLTGCLNHGAFNERLAEEIERAVRYGYPMSLVVGDADQFKSLNDAYGHLVGDAALALVGTTLRETSRRSDLVGRMGGDEFAVLLPGTAVDAAALLAHRIFDAHGTGIGQLTFSVGVASLDVTQPTAEDLYRAADEALYHAKRGGGHAIAVASRSGEPALSLPIAPALRSA